MRESLVWTAGFLTVLVAAKWVLLQSVSAFADEPLFDYRLLQIASPQAVLFDAVAYGLYTPIQEFVVRGALQGSLQRTLGGPHVALRAILFSTLIFTTLHLHLSVSYALLTFVPSLFWGAMFARQRSLVGVSLSQSSSVGSSSTCSGCPASMCIDRRLGIGIDGSGPDGSAERPVRINAGRARDTDASRRPMPRSVGCAPLPRGGSNR